MKLFRRKPRITEENYGKLMTSFGRVAPRDPFVWEPARALAEKVVGEFHAEVAELDSSLYSGAAEYHLQLLSASWLMAEEGSVPHATAEVFEEAVAWKFGPLVKGSGQLARRTSELARGNFERDTHEDAAGEP
jgi:hypothetical protein